MGERWRNTLDISDIYPKAEAEEITAQAFAAGVAERLDKLIPELRDVAGSDIIEARRIQELFDDAGRDESVDVDDVDQILSDLYDWGNDRSIVRGGNICWIRTQPHL